MPGNRATREQIKAFEAIVTQAWGGEAKLKELFNLSPHYQSSFVEAVHGRYFGSLDIITPWVERLCPDIRARRLFEIGCGTGSSTAALSTISEFVTGLDILPGEVSIAQSRLDCFEIKNATVEACSFPEILDRLDLQERVDAVLLFAVLEHMYVHERINMLKIAWAKLPPGGLIIVGETPNRLCYFDVHTFEQPFANMLPPDLAKLWSQHCVSDTTRKSLEEAPSEDFMQLREKLTRMGQCGPSFHEFEIALGIDVHKNIISAASDIGHVNGPYIIEQSLLLQYLRYRLPHVHEVFSMPVLYLILKKPHI